MSKQPQSKGKCFYCGKSYAKGGMSRHLQACKTRQSAIQANDKKKSRAKAVDIFHLVVEGYYDPYYWLHLEIPAQLMLSDVDSFLRDIWLECCGHLSRFEINGQSYSVHPMSEFRERSMSYTLGDVLDIGMQFAHEYDYGSTTDLSLRVVDRRQGKPEKKIGVMARNLPPEIICQICKENPATLINVYAYGDDNDMWFCEDCATDEDEVYYLPNVNSPRVGVCGYEGPVGEDVYAI